ncbi:viral responsive protein [Penaeus vannamei]|uniref:Viral responsive protein n=1 Tax=Penaeus vannamei TaxID=6689 RepID=A0A3R7PU12_PENVA|nr:viral responsive protein [Penaeus vannamei]
MVRQHSSHALRSHLRVSERSVRSFDNSLVLKISWIPQHKIHLARVHSKLSSIQHCVRSSVAPLIVLMEQSEIPAPSTLLRNVRFDALLNLVCGICEEKKLRPSMKYTAGGTLAVALTTGVGVLLFGPVGFLAGSATGGLVSFLYTRGKFKSAARIIMEDLTPEERERLLMRVKGVLENFGYTVVNSENFSQLRGPIASEIAAIVKAFLEAERGLTLRAMNA